MNKRSFNFQFSIFKQPARGGYALLFAILVTSILLSAGLGISNIIYKELLLSGIGKQSTISFYAADTGAECALYWERHKPVGSGSSFPKDSTEAIASVALNPMCASRDIFSGIRNNLNNNSMLSDALGRMVTTFTLELPFSGNPCALVVVTKGTGVTLIESRGFNLPCSGVENVKNSRRVERALRYRIQSTS